MVGAGTEETLLLIMVQLDLEREMSLPGTENWEGRSRWRRKSVHRPGGGKAGHAPDCRSPGGCPVG